MRIFCLFKSCYFSQSVSQTKKSEKGEGIIIRTLDNHNNIEGNRKPMFDLLEFRHW